MISDFKNHPLDYEIDLCDALSALIRQRRWLISLAFVGVLLGAISAINQKPEVKLTHIINLNDGPLKRVVLRLGGEDGPDNLSVDYKPKYTPQEIAIVFRRCLHNSSYITKGLSQLDLGHSGEAIIKSNDILFATSNASVASLYSHRQAMEEIRSCLVGHIKSRLSASDIAPKSSFVEEYSELPLPLYRGRIILFWAIVGLLAGVATALLQDLRANRVYSVRHLLRLLDYPLLASLQHQSSFGQDIDASLAQLRELLNPHFEWIILSIVNHHPSVDRLAAALEVTPVPPLLTNPLQSDYNKTNRGVLIVIEPGFNSAQSLQEAKRLLDHLPGIGRVDLILISSHSAQHLPS